ncbi:hypothetical protein HGI47_10755 [Novosphingobium sp. ERN07]|uniref:hypothetical protein n=1 Tax=Novosphingobium sp. ERN07 TaxID=2726187 RepID=UPI00145730AC|nr:hypothetical protein [Novosphingobium sp. ERN07]NLR71351.1 hypothetical protein [Novosphingobium sp. ERN07]
MAFIAVFAQNEPFERSQVVGCYVAPQAPSLEIGLNEIRVIELEQRKLNYEPQPSKTSYVLNVRPALQLKPTANGQYTFEQVRGIGYFWSLLPEDGVNRNRIRHPDEYSGRFEIHASDGKRLVYVRQTTSRLCE